MIFDVSNNKHAKDNYENEHIAGALFVDINTQLADIKEDLAQGGRHPLPEAVQFAKTLTNLGITKQTHVILYDDNNGSNAATRFWWMLRSVGHEKVQVLNGGLNQAKRNNFPMSSNVEIMKSASAPYQISQWNWPTIEMNEVEKISQDQNYLVIDVRDKDRYDGKAEPIDLIAGHIPGAINVPFKENLDQNGLFINPTELRKKYEAIFKEVKTDNIVIHCGSGVTACHTILALDYAELEIPILYVGSWSEWSRNDKKMERVSE